MTDTVGEFPKPSQMRELREEVRAVVDSSNPSLEASFKLTEHPALSSLRPDHLQDIKTEIESMTTSPAERFRRAKEGGQVNVGQRELTETFANLVAAGNKEGMSELFDAYTDWQLRVAPKDKPADETRELAKKNFDSIARMLDDMSSSTRYTEAYKKLAGNEPEESADKETEHRPLSPREIRDLLQQAIDASRNKDIRGVARIQIKLNNALVQSDGHENAEAEDEDIRYTNGRAAMASVILDHIFVDTLDHNPEALLTFAPIFDVLCSAPPDSLVGDMHWDESDYSKEAPPSSPPPTSTA